MSRDIQLHVSPDKLQVTVSAKVRRTKIDQDPAAIEQEIQRLIDEHNVTTPPDDGVLKTVVERLRRGMDTSNLVIARGTPPVNGQDGMVQVSFPSGPSIGEHRRDGSIDFRERDFLKSTQSGELLARIVPPTPGTPGKDVFGNSIEPLRGKEETVTMGENVSVSEDGSLFHATSTGSIQFVHNVLSVTEVITVSGDVDYSTGNIYMDYGSLIIHGSVLSNFKVIACGNIVVNNTVEDAVVVSGGDLHVRQGIIMGENGHIKVDGQLVARYAQNARIETDGNVVIGGGIVNSEIVAGDQIIASQGIGRIRGGFLRAGCGIEANEIGGPNHISTRVEIGIPQKSVREFAARLESLKKKKTALERKLGKDALTEDDSDRVSARDSPDLAMLRQTTKKIAKTERLIEKKEQQIRREFGSRIRVKGKVFPGVTVVIVSRVFQVTSELREVEFYYDAEEDTVKTCPLRR